MSNYSGNSEKCPSCELTYGKFRTGLKYYDVYLMIDGLNPESWKYKRRGTVLGLWFEIKQDLWSRHQDECSAFKQALDEVPF